MSKLTQKQLLEASFWDKFAPAMRQSIAVGKELAKVVAPETYQAVKNIKDWSKDVRKKYVQAGKDKDERTVDYLLSKGHYPLPEPSKARIAWIRDEDDPSILVGTLKVGKAETYFDSSGKPAYRLSATFRDPNTTVQYDKDSKQISIVRSPYTRNLTPEVIQNGKAPQSASSSKPTGKP